MGMNDRHTVQGVPNIGLQPTSPHGDEQTIVVQVSVFVELQPASLHRDERNNLIKNQLYRIFSSHPVRDEHLWVCKTIHNSYFNPHPRIEVNFHLLLPVSEIQSFNPHPRMGMNRWPASRKGDIFCISTHTPVWGWTPRYGRNLPPTSISTHTPAWGWTPRGFKRPCNQVITTHTPVWGWTTRIDPSGNRYQNYNPHPLTGMNETIW